MMDSYVLRVYQRDRMESGMLVGTIEDIKRKRRYHFRTVDELLSLLQVNPLHTLDSDDEVQE